MQPEEEGACRSVNQPHNNYTLIIIFFLDPSLSFFILCVWVCDKLTVGTALFGRASSSDSSGNKVVVVRRGFLCFTNNREAICVNDGAEVVLVPGGPQWKAHIMQEEDASEIKLVLKHVERKDNSEERKKECVASLMNEVQRRKAEIAALTNDLTNLTNRCGEVGTHISFFLSVCLCCIHEPSITIIIIKCTVVCMLLYAERRSGILWRRDNSDLRR